MNKRKINIVFFGWLILSCVSLHAFSQTVKATPDRDRIYIGEQIKIKLSVEGGTAGITWFKFSDSVNHLDILQRSKIDTVLSGKVTNYYQTITITSFDSGRWEFPSLSIANINKTTAPVSIDVLPVDVSKMQDYNDIKDIEDVEPENNWLITGIIAAVTLFSLFMLVWLFIKKKRAALLNQDIKNRLSPLDWALAELSKLNAKSLQSPAEVKKYYSELSRISRTFFNMQMSQKSLQQTTDEWMVSLLPLSVDNETKTTFFQFLRMADTVKFAKYLPPSTENETSAEVTKNMFQKVSLLHSNVYSKYQPQKS